MKLALVTPLPPARSGIADYSDALAAALRAKADVTVIDHAGARFSPPSFDAIVYQIGNNGDHAFVYELALQHPGYVVLHEANLHHLITELTIRRQDWDGYLREVEFDGGPAALEFAQRVRRLEAGPDYEGVPMLRRLLGHARGLIAHSHYVADAARAAGYSGPVAVIPHGAWIPPVNGWPYRSRLGILNPEEPLIGIFGHLKPYKRIHESLRAFRRLVRAEPRAKLILVGEPHESLQLEGELDRLGLTPFVRLTGRTGIDEFVGYLAAADIVLNLRFPTVGETSGTLQRALGLGRAVLVSDVGAFAEYPDDVCIKVPVGAGEEDVLFESLQLLIARPDLRGALGERARQWVARECSWPLVADRYLEFLATGEAGPRPAPAPSPAPAEPVEASPAATPRTVDRQPLRSGVERITRWTGTTPESAGYVQAHLTRLMKTLDLIPPGSPEEAILEMGAYMQITPALHFDCGYGTVRGCYYGPAGIVEDKVAASIDGDTFRCSIDLFDAERDPFPYPDASFAAVVCGELIEHLPSDPMHLMFEVHRILRPGGHLVLTTPNIASLRAIAAILEGYHPGFYPAYLKPEALAKGESRHNREYTPREVHLLFHYAGFTVTTLETGPFDQSRERDFDWTSALLARYGFDPQLRGDGIYAVGRKTGQPLERYPAWLYS